MLKRALVVLLLATSSAGAQDAESHDGLRRPQQLTVGVGDQFLGQLSPDGRMLYFVSNRNTANEIYRQDTKEQRTQLVFDEGADTSWPRISPDGKQLLYISFRDEASGQLCVRQLPGGENRRCLPGDLSALQAEWQTSSQVMLLARASIDGDLRVLEVTVGSALTSRPFRSQNLTGLALSPDRRWLVYLPIVRYTAQIGPGFAARAAPRLEALRLDGTSAPVPVTLDLPGSTAQPVFAPDGNALYVSQFLSDSNQDGVVDASDHGVLFQVPFPSSRDDAPAIATASAPTQLTDASWNCQYPAPTRKELIATCSRGGSLAVFSLPPDGMVPRDWTVERLRSEADLATPGVTQQLLLRQLLAKETDVAARRLVMMRLIRLHSRMGELEPAGFYARKVGELNDPASEGIASALQTLIDHRKAIRDRDRGRLSVDFADDSRKRMASLKPAPGLSRAALAFQELVRSEIADDLGEPQLAHEALQAAQIDEVTLPSVLQAYADRAEAYYRKTDDREHLVAAYRKLAAHASLSPDAQLPFARAAVRTEVRGLSHDEAEAQLRQQKDQGELEFSRQLELVLLQIRDAHPKNQVLETLRSFYQHEPSLTHRRQIMADAIERGGDLSAERVTETLVTLYVDDTPPGTDERRRAERLFQQVLMGRAYRRLSRQKFAEARDDFEAVAKRTGALEAYVGAIDAEMRLKTPPETIAAKYSKVTPKETARFVEAYRMARQLPHLTGKEHEKTVDAAIALLKGVWSELKDKREAQSLRGALLHERFLEEGDRAAAESANLHYLIALELVRSNMREKAQVLGQLALLQAGVGNWRIALGSLQQREKLPFVDNGAGLAVRLARARCLLHVDREPEAALAADEALVLLGQNPHLEEYRPLVTDRAALYHLASRDFARALQLYDQEMPWVDASTSARNRVVVHLARAAAEMGAHQPARALQDLDQVDAQLVAEKLPVALRREHVQDPDVLRSYRLIAAGLRANAHHALGQLDAADLALLKRHAIFQERAKAAPKLLENQRALTLSEARLAMNAADQGDKVKAASWVGQALLHADLALKDSGAAMDQDTLGVLWIAAELEASGGKAPFPIQPRLGAAYEAAVKQDDPARRLERGWLETYLHAAP